MQISIPGHIRKAFHSLEKFAPIVDSIIELVDARMPFSSRIPGFLEQFKKPSMIILAKADLADPNQNSRWISYFEAQGQPCQEFSATDHYSVKQLRNRLLAIIKANYSNSCRLMVVGIPNVGKSTLINALAGRKAAKTGNLPGVTRNIQWIKLGDGMEMLDMPGVLDFKLLKHGDILKLINTIPNIENDPISDARRLYALLEQIGSAAMLTAYDAAPQGSFDSYLELYAKRMNFLLRGNKLDLNRAALDMLKRFQSGGFGRLTLETADCNVILQDSWMVTK